LATTSQEVWEEEVVERADEEEKEKFMNRFVSMRAKKPSWD
jgi:hypothetical protein